MTLAVRGGARLDRLSALLVAVAAGLWASDSYFRPVLVQHHLTGSQIVLVEDLLVSLCFIPLLVRVGREVRRLSLRSWAALILIAVGPQAVATVLFTEAFKHAFPAEAAPNFNIQIEIYLLYLLQPVFGLAFARLFLGERRRPYFWPLALVAVAAVYMIVFPEHPLDPFASAQQGELAAAGLVLGAVVLWALGTVMGRYTLREVSFVTTTGMRFVLALPVLLVLMLIEGGSSGFAGYSSADFPSFIGVALVPGFLAMLLYYRGLSSTPASMATLAELAFPATLFISYTLPAPVGHGAPLQPAMVVGAVILAGAVTALNLLKSRDVVVEPAAHELRPATDAA